MPSAKKVTHRFPTAFRDIRLARRLAQTAFILDVSQVHVSNLERGKSHPTLETVDDLAASLGVHPLSLLALSYAKKRDGKSVRALLDQVEAELADLSLIGTTSSAAVQPPPLPRG